MMFLSSSISKLDVQEMIVTQHIKALSQNQNHTKQKIIDV